MCINGGTILSYTGRQYGLLVICATLDFLALSFSVIAFQSCELGFISLFGYLIVIYSFLADTFVFCENFTAMEVSGCLMIFTVTLGIGTFKYLMDRKEKENLSKVNLLVDKDSEKKSK